MEPAASRDPQAAPGAPTGAGGGPDGVTAPADEPGLTRRGFLRGVAGGTAAVAVASVLPAGCAPGYPEQRQDGGRLEALTPKEYAVARAAAEAMLVGVPVAPDAVASGIDRELAVAGEPMRTDMKTVLSLMEHGGLLSLRPQRFSAMSVAARQRVLHHWATSRINLRRAAFQALKGFVVYFAYADDATRSLTRFPGPWPEKVAIPAYPIDFGDVALPGDAVRTRGSDGT